MGCFGGAAAPLGDTRSRHAPAAPPPSQAKLGANGGLVASVGVGKALKAGWIALEGGLLKPKATSITDDTAEQLKAIASAVGEPALDANVLKDLKKRKLAQQVYVPALPFARSFE